jgi:protoporphyrinogen IX oxidase
MMHIISLVAWFAGIFYIWRLFVYHSETESEDVRSTLSVMERKLYKYIMNPAMYSTILFGTLLFLELWEVYKNQFWIWAKIFLVSLLIGFQFLADSYRLKLLEGKRYNSKRFRILNEVPTLILIAVVYLVVFKP